jgi:Gpi18-like mannosyltransferase
MRTTWKLAALVAVAALIRLAAWPVVTGDMRIFFMWYHQVGDVGGARAIGADVGNYNAPFVYLLAFLHLVPGPLIFKFKAAFVVFDAVLAYYTYKITGLRKAAIAVLFLPTVMINASLWGQIDAMWAGLALAGVYYLLRDRPWLAMALFGAALAIKPQAIFVFPLLLLLTLGGRLPLRTLIAAPAVFLALDLPAVLAGRNPAELLTIYDMGRQSHVVEGLTLRAPSVYAFLPAGAPIETVRVVGYVVTIVAVATICALPAVRRAGILPAATLFAIMVPFLLPGMHERYFFLADVLTVALALGRPRLWYIPVLVQAASLISYAPYLLGGYLMPMAVPAALMLAALLATTTTLAPVSRPAPVRLPVTSLPGA